MRLNRKKVPENRRSRQKRLSTVGLRDSYLKPVFVKGTGESSWANRIVDATFVTLNGTNRLTVIAYVSNSIKNMSGNVYT